MGNDSNRSWANNKRDITILPPFVGGGSLFSSNFTMSLKTAKMCFESIFKNPVSISSSKSLQFKHHKRLEAQAFRRDFKGRKGKKYL